MARYHISEDVKNVVRELEGFSATAYTDASGHSIGYGHFIKPGEEHLREKKITREEAEVLLEKDIEEHQRPWIGILKDDTPPHVVSALTSFAYNAGASSAGVIKAARAINAGDMEGAARIMSQYKKSFDPKLGKKVENPVLIKRREFEARLMAGEKVSWSEFGKKKGFLSNTVDYFKGLFGGKTASGFSTAISDQNSVLSCNAEVLQGLKELNRDLRSQGAEENWLNRLKKEGSGMWAAKQ